MHAYTYFHIHVYKYTLMYTLTAGVVCVGGVCRSPPARMSVRCELALRKGMCAYHFPRCVSDGITMSYEVSGLLTMYVCRYMCMHMYVSSLLDYRSSVCMPFSHGFMTK
jgi:hypothetical protein